MSEIQNSNERLQVLSNWECSWQAPEILDIIMCLATGKDLKYSAEWLESLRAQDLFNLASVLASGRPDMRNYFYSEQMYRAIIDYQFDPDEFLYLPEPNFWLENFAEDLVEEYGMSSDTKTSIGYYIQKIMDAKRLNGIVEAVELLNGAKRAILAKLPTAARAIFVEVATVGAQSFHGDLARTYAMLALIDVILTMDNCLNNTEKENLSRDKYRFNFIAKRE